MASVTQGQPPVGEDDVQFGKRLGLPLGVLRLEYSGCRGLQLSPTMSMTGTPSAWQRS